MRYDGENFYNAIKIQFADCLDEVSKLNFINSKDLSDPLYLANSLISLFSFYAGRILEDGEETGLYIGPAEHRVKTILSKYVSDANNLLSASICDNINDIELRRKECYKDLNSLGCSQKRAKEILSKRG